MNRARAFRNSGWLIRRRWIAVLSVALIGIFLWTGIADARVGGGGSFSGGGGGPSGGGGGRLCGSECRRKFCKADSPFALLGV